MLNVIKLEKDKLHDAIKIWNEVVQDGNSFPQTELLDIESGSDFFASQSFTGIAVDNDTNKVVGLYILQFNAVVSTNLPALKLYEKMGFTQLGVIPNGFRMPDNRYTDIIPHYIEL